MDPRRQVVDRVQSPSRRAAVAALALAALLGACGADDGPRTVESADATVLVAAPTDDGATALITGIVSVVDGCLGIDEEVAVWPSGTRVTDPDGPVIDVPGLGAVRVGDRVEGAGGHLPAGALTDESSPTVPGSCAGAGLVVYRPE